MLSHIEPQNINLNSIYATNKNDNGNRCSFELSKSIIIPNNVSCYVKLNSFKYTNVFYNVTSTKNILYYSFNGGVTINTIVVPVGNYTVNTLITALSSNGFTLTYSSLSFKLTIANATPFILLNGTNDISRVLGYQSFSTPTTSYICRNSINLLGSQVINIQLQGVNISTTTTANGVPSVLESVPINVSAGSSFSYTPNSNTEFKCNNISITTIYINLTDEYNEDLNLLGSSFFVSLHFRFLYPNELRLDRGLDNLGNATFGLEENEELPEEVNG